MGYFYALLAALMFGLNGSVTKVIIAAGLSPAQLTLFRVGGTAIIAGIILLIGNRNAFSLSRHQLTMMAVLGLFSVALLQFAYTAAISLLPVGIVLLLEYTAVLMVPLVAFFFLKEKVRARLWIAIIFVIAGLVVVAQIWASRLNPLGVILALTAAVSLTVYFVIGEREVGRSSPLTVAFWTMGFASVFWMIFSGWWQINPALFGTSVSLSGNWAVVNVPLWMLLLWSILAGSFVPYLLSLLALKHLTATTAGIVGSIEMVFAFLFAWLWLSEGLTPVQIIGTVVVIFGIALAQTARASKLVDTALALVPNEPVFDEPSSPPSALEGPIATQSTPALHADVGGPA